VGRVQLLVHGSRAVVGRIRSRGQTKVRVDQLRLNHARESVRQSVGTMYMLVMLSSCTALGSRNQVTFLPS
jgi:hypothetical protein